MGLADVMRCVPAASTTFQKWLLFSHSGLVEAEDTLSTDAGGESANVSGEVIPPTRHT